MSSKRLRRNRLSPIFVGKRKKADLVFWLNKTPLNNDDEAYRLAVQSPDSKKQIVARADAKEGLLYALQTLRQLAQQENGTVVVPSCVITDAPAFPWRAFMLDESRHFHGMAAVKDLLDEMARLKLNTFHWHLVDDPGWRIEIKKYPLLTERARSATSHTWILRPKAGTACIRNALTIRRTRSAK